MLKNIRKRNGKIAVFQPEKIEKAAEAAFKVSQEGGSESSRLIASMVINKLSKQFRNEHIPDVEYVQDLVIGTLKEAGYHRTADIYSGYRTNQSYKREALQNERLKSFTDGKPLHLNAASGSFSLDHKDFVSWLRQLAKDLPNVKILVILENAVRNLPCSSSVSDADFRKELTDSCLIFLENHYNYSYLASRILLSQFYESVLEMQPFSAADINEFSDLYRKGFYTYLDTGIENELLHPLLKSGFDLNRIAESIVPKRDLLFQYRGTRTITDRYLLRTRIGKKIFELPQYFWMRVAMGLALAEKEHERTSRAISFYNIISQLLYVPSTPTLFNAGTLYPQLSSCFTITVEDSLEGIFRSYSDAAKLSKYSGGIGADWTNVRAMGSAIKGTNGSSQGVIPFLKIFNDIAVAVNQGGKRKGALAAYLEIWHADVEAFLEAKKNTGDERRRLHDMHTALWVPDLFMKRVEADGDWTLFSPDEVPDLHSLYGKKFDERYEEYEKMNLPSARTVRALGLWKKALTMLFETGHPWITFKDPCNIRSPQQHDGVIYGSNLCTEITLNSSPEETAVCNLGSLNLSLLTDTNGLDEKLLSETVKTAVRMLDNVIDLNLYPTEASQRSNLRHRAVGLGIMGYQEALYKLNIAFDSKENIEFADRSMEMISWYAIDASAELAKERGAYSSYKGSLWDRGIFPVDTIELLEKERGRTINVNRRTTMNWDALKEKVRLHGLRNSNLMAIAPTATISNICGTTPSAEPAFRNIYVKENTDGSFLVMNPALIDSLSQLGLWNEDIIRKIKINNGSLANITEIPEKIRRVFQTAYDIDPSVLIEAAAVRGKWIDQSQSLNLFVKTASGKKLSDLYMQAHHMGLKTTYYLRSLSAVSAEKFSSTEKYPATLSIVNPDKGIGLNSGELCRVNDPGCESCQ